MPLAASKLILSRPEIFGQLVATDLMPLAASKHSES